MIRVNWVDNTKAIAIYLVVLGHFPVLWSPFKNLIYSFHLPIFLVVSGFLITNKLSTLSIKGLFYKQLNYQIKLYLLFSFTSILLFVLGQTIIGQPYDILTLSEASLYGVHGAERLLGHGNGALWYFPFYIVSVFVFYFVLKLPRPLQWSVTFLFAFFSVTYDGVRLPWAFDIAGVGLFFLILGSDLKLYYQKLQPVLCSKISLVLVPLGLILLLYTTNIAGSANINRLAFTNNGFLFFVNAIIGCLVVILIAHHIKYYKVVELVSKNTLIIFCVHLYFVKSFRFLKLIDSVLIKLSIIVLLSFIITYICMQLSQLIMPFLNKHILNKNTYLQDMESNLKK